MRAHDIAVILYILFPAHLLSKLTWSEEVQQTETMRLPLPMLGGRPCRQVYADRYMTLSSFTSPDLL